MRLTRNRLIAVGVAAALVVGGAGAAFAVAGGGDDGDQQASGPGADRARAAALVAVPGGTANAVERDGENGATWEVEVTRPGGGTVDVRLDDRYGVVVIEGDTEAADDTERDERSTISCAMPGPSSTGSARARRWRPLGEGN